MSKYIKNNKQLKEFSDDLKEKNIRDDEVKGIQGLIKQINKDDIY